MLQADFLKTDNYNLSQLFKKIKRQEIFTQHREEKDK